MQAIQKFILIVGVYLCVSSWGQSSAQLNYHSSQRTVSAFASVCETDSDESTTTVVGPFSSAVSAHESDASEFCQGVANSAASQASNLTRSRISGAGDSSASAAAGVVSATGTSSVNARFEIMRMSRYLLAGELDGGITTLFGDFPGEAHFSLGLKGGPVLHAVDQAMAFTPERFSFAGLLSAGTYEFDATAESRATVDEGASASFDVSLSLIALTSGDYNANGFVEQGDLDLVLLNWGRKTPPIPKGWIHDLPEALIEQAELDQVLLNWSRVKPLSSWPVPEPSGCGLLAWIVGWLLVRGGLPKA